MCRHLLSLKVMREAKRLRKRNKRRNGVGARGYLKQNYKKEVERGYVLSVGRNGVKSTFVP
jgi:hypothetical protein